MPKNITAGGAMPSAPTIGDVQSEMYRLTNLIELLDDLLCDLTAEGLDEEPRKRLFRSQNLLSLTVEFSRAVEAKVDAYARGVKP